MIYQLHKKYPLATPETAKRVELKHSVTVAPVMEEPDHVKRRTSVGVTSAARGECVTSAARGECVTSAARGECVTSAARGECYYEGVYWLSGD